MAQFRYPQQQTTITGGATEAKQDDIITELQDVNTELDSQTALLTDIELNTDDVSTETTLATRASEATLAALDAKVTAVDTTGKATEAKQDDAITQLTTISGDTTSLDSKIPAQGAALTAASTPVNIASDQTVPVSISSQPLPTGAATEAKQDSAITELQSANTSLDNIEADIDALNARLAGNLVPETFDDIQVSYVAAGNGAGEIETVEYRTGGGAGTLVKTLTLVYDAQDRLIQVTAS